MIHCMVEKKGWMNSFFWLSRFWRMPSATDTVERQLQHADRNAVNVDHHIRALGAGLGVRTLDGHFFSNGEMVFLWVLPVDQPHRHLVFTHRRQYLDAVAQQLVHLVIAVVDALAGVAGNPVQLVQCAGDEGAAYTLFFQPGSEQFGGDVAVVAVDLVAQIVVAQPLLKQGDDAGLRALFDLADGRHTLYSLSRSVDHTCFTSAATRLRRSFCAALSKWTYGVNGSPWTCLNAANCGSCS